MNDTLYRREYNAGTVNFVLIESKKRGNIFCKGDKNVSRIFILSF